LDKPLLIDGYKFDLRVYALVLSVDPLRIYCFNDGLVRLCTEKYKRPTNRNIKNHFIHLTNYAINKKNATFSSHQDKEFSSGYKRCFKWFNKFLEEKGFSVKKFWSKTHGIIIKTIISVLATLKQNYRTCMASEQHGPFCCFEILGFDIMLDDKANPWLIEVNHSPSFNTDTELDYSVKYRLLSETLQLLGIDPMERVRYLKRQRALARERIIGVEDLSNSIPNYPELSHEEMIERQDEIERKVLKNFVRIFPTSSSQKYSVLLEQQNTLYMRLTDYTRNNYQPIWKKEDKRPKSRALLRISSRINLREKFENPVTRPVIHRLLQKSLKDEESGENNDLSISRLTYPLRRLSLIDDTKLFIRR